MDDKNIQSEITIIIERYRSIVYNRKRRETIAKNLNDKQLEYIISKGWYAPPFKEICAEELDNRIEQTLLGEE